ncbi:hypothetical protein E2C01_091107 [Portunus trituberculatus]|uniref:Uncharacterized protein n=1 Tax=Portunus trituberculatus TaxID=210409 RepID=A0A5B7JRW7_PORTR|nr:hypothetical protein [Portunus trituberculatus]
MDCLLAKHSHFYTGGATWKATDARRRWRKAAGNPQAATRPLSEGFRKGHLRLILTVMHL